MGGEGRRSLGRLRVRRPRQDESRCRSTSVYKLTPEQLDAWRATVEPLKASWAAAVKQAGDDPDAALAELKAAIAKYGAGP